MESQPPPPANSWYLVYAKPRQEEVALTNLARQGYRVYLPRARRTRRRQGRRIITVEPLFPRYLFIHLDAHTDNWGPVRSTLGVASLVRFGVLPARVPDDLVALLRSRETAGGLRECTEPVPRVGQRVRVTEGPLRGYQGIFEAQTGHERVVILLEILSRKVRANLNPGQLDSEHP